MTIDGAPTTAWYNLNPTTGEVIAESQSGGYQSLIEYTLAFLTGFSVATVVLAAIDSYNTNGNIPGWEKAAKSGALGFLAAISGIIVVPFALTTGLALDRGDCPRRGYRLGD